MTNIFNSSEMMAMDIPKQFPYLHVLPSGDTYHVFPQSGATRSLKEYKAVLATGETRIQRVKRVEWLLDHHHDTIKLHEVDL